MKMTIKIPNHKRKFKFSGEVKTLAKIIQLIKTMTHDEQVRTLIYLNSRLHDQITIGDVEILNGK